MNFQLSLKLDPDFELANITIDYLEDYKNENKMHLISVICFFFTTFPKQAYSSKNT